MAGSRCKRSDARISLPLPDLGDDPVPVIAVPPDRLRTKLSGEAPAALRLVVAVEAQCGEIVEVVTSRVLIQVVQLIGASGSSADAAGSVRCELHVRRYRIWNFGSVLRHGTCESVEPVQAKCRRLGPAASVQRRSSWQVEWRWGRRLTWPGSEVVDQITLRSSDGPIASG
jgi:hypothetical protein